MDMRAKMGRRSEGFSNVGWEEIDVGVLTCMGRSQDILLKTNDSVCTAGMMHVQIYTCALLLTQLQPTMHRQSASLSFCKH